jgi:hypothetical protein
MDVNAVYAQVFGKCIFDLGCVCSKNIFDNVKNSEQKFHVYISADYVHDQVSW